MRQGQHNTDESMSEQSPPAYCFYKVFAPESRKPMCFDRHYLLYAAKGALRLEADDRHWILPPTRAVWIPANTPIHIEIPHEVTCCSILFHPDFITSKISTCQVLNLSNVAREMILHTKRWGPTSKNLSAHAKSFFRTLASTCAELAGESSNVWIPKGKTKELQAALIFTKTTSPTTLHLETWQTPPSCLNVLCHADLPKKSI